jgi:hypothetical protein
MNRSSPGKGVYRCFKAVIDRVKICGEACYLGVKLGTYCANCRRAFIEAILIQHVADRFE